MSSTKETSTTKTAHVMNLLRKTIPAEPEPTTSEAPQQAAAPAQPQSTPQTPPIITSIQEEAEVSNQIKNALEDALSAADVAVPEPAEAEIHPTPEPEPEEAPPPQPEPEAPAPEAAPEASTPGQTAPEPEPEPEPAAPVAVTVELFGSATTDVDTNTGVLTYVNVMQALVDEKAPKYMKMFGLCECPRCQADVKALALNRLDPKYVVMPKDGAIPRLTLYEGQYSSAVIAQLLYACKVVMEHPRHDR